MRTKDGFKYSVHCVVNVACTKQINYFTARILDKLLSVQLGVSIVDTGIYNPNSTLRLPGSIKVNDKTGPENRVFTFDKTSKFNDFIISDIHSKKCAITFKNDLIFDPRPPITISRHSALVSAELINKAL